jgi:hypothetical protein
MFVFIVNPLGEFVLVDIPDHNHHINNLLNSSLLIILLSQIQRPHCISDLEISLRRVNIRVVYVKTDREAV